MLQGLDPLYYEEGFKAVHHELSVLGLDINSIQLEETAEARTSVLEVRWGVANRFLACRCCQPVLMSVACGQSSPDKVMPHCSQG